MDEQSVTLADFRVAAYRQLVLAIIDDAMHELENPEGSVSASKFFTSEWLSVLCLYAQIDTGRIRTHAQSLPGYLSYKERRERSIDLGAARKSRLKKNRKRRIELVAINPAGEATRVFGYDFVAKMIGCTYQAVYYAVRDNRPCFGWRFVRKEEYRKEASA